LQPGVINLGQRSGAEAQMLSQRSVNAVVVRVRLDRNPETGAITTFFDGDQIGQPLPLTRPDAPLLPALYVRSGGAVISVTRWTIFLR
jgi:hypothetical protein